jgi:NADH-quinone oxidoreductase subunit L
MDMKSLYLLIALSPLVGSIIAGLFGWAIGRRASHVVTILGVAVSAALSFKVLYAFLTGQAEVFNAPVYTWLTVGAMSSPSASWWTR